jgi:hypothetical protein
LLTRKPWVSTESARALALLGLPVLKAWRQDFAPGL